MLEGAEREGDSERGVVVCRLDLCDADRQICCLLPPQTHTHTHTHTQACTHQVCTHATALHMWLCTHMCACDFLTDDISNDHKFDAPLLSRISRFIIHCLFPSFSTPSIRTHIFTCTGKGSAKDWNLVTRSVNTLQHWRSHLCPYASASPSSASFSTIKIFLFLKKKNCGM